MKKKSLQSSKLEFSAPGRTELIGNHTDHQHGCILSSAISNSVNAEVEPTDDGIITIISDGYDSFNIDISDLEMKEAEIASSASLVRGVAAGFEERGLAIPSFIARISSDVPAGKGLSSSAAFEILIGRIINELGGHNLSPFELAVIGKNAENKYYGKPCGLQDQTVSAYGKTILVDFFNPENPAIEEIPFCPSEHGYALCLIDSKGSHDNLTDDFSSITIDMSTIAKHFGHTHLRHIDENAFIASKDELIKKYGQLATDRAQHFFGENRRVPAAADALKRDDFDEFLELVNLSGRSSETLLRNTISQFHPEMTELQDTLALLKELLDGRGAYRVHGGGFAGTAQSYVPLNMLDEFQSAIERKLGADSFIRLA